MTDQFDALRANLRRSPFGEADANDVFEQSSNIPTVPTSGIEDIGFTPEQLAMLRNGLYNGDFRTPPPDPDSELDDLTNKLPGWSYVKNGTAVTAKWQDTGGDGGNITFSIAAGAATADDAYLEQVIPVSAIGSRRVAKLVTATCTNSSAVDADPMVVAQYLQEDGDTTGTEATRHSASGGGVDTWTACPNGEAGVPTDGYFLRVRVKVDDIGSSSATVVLKDVVVEERFVIPANIEHHAMAGNSNAFTADDRMHEAQVISVDPSSNYEIRGINSTGSPQGRILWLHNENSTNTVTLIHESGSASAEAYRIVCPNNSDLTIRPRGTVMLCYFAGSGGVSRWRVMSQV